MSSLKNEIISATELWQVYEGCLAAHTSLAIDSDTERAYRFYEGDQWYGLESSGEELPIYNFIAPVVRYKTSMVAMNNMSINYSAPSADARMQKVAAMLTGHALKKWESMQMDRKCQDACKAAAIGGDSYVYFFDGDSGCQLIDRTDIFFADEGCADISAQEYILIRERRAARKIRELAMQNGVGEEVAMTIMPDGEQDDDKCTCVLMLSLRNGDLHFQRFTKTVVCQPEQVIKGLGIYPIASLKCGERRGSARGVGEVLPLIANQIEINRNLARRLVNAKLTAYSRLVYASDKIAEPSSLCEVGTAIEVEGGGISSIKDAVSYLTPSPMSPDAKSLSDELLKVSKDLAGAGDAALGSINPTEASGAAIIAVRDQAALPLNEQTARFKQFAEDIARIWYRLWVVYNPAGMVLTDGGQITADELARLEPEVRIDISNSSPFSKYAREQALEKLFSMGHITFDEYVSSLDDDSSVPKSKLMQIIKNREGVNNGDNEN